MKEFRITRELVFVKTVPFKFEATGDEFKTQIQEIEANLQPGEFLKFEWEGSYESIDINANIWRCETDQEYEDAKSRWNQEKLKQLERRLKREQRSQEKSKKAEEVEYQLFLKLKSKYEEA